MLFIIGKEPMTCPTFVASVYLNNPEHLLTTPLPSTPSTLYVIAVH